MIRPKSSKAGAYRRKLERTVLRISDGPGQPARNVPAIELIRAAERSLAAEDFVPVSRLGEQLRRTAGLECEGLRLLLQVAVTLSRPRDAWSCTRQLQDAGAPDARIALALAQGLEFCNRQKEALGVVDAALRGAPANAHLRHLRGQLLAALDDLDGAEAELRRALMLDPRLYTPYRQLALIGRITTEDVARLEKTDVPDASKADAFMALAAGYRRQGNHAREFAWLDRAHAALRARDPWVPGDDEEMLREIAEVFTPAFLAQMPALPEAAQRPIFVIGMPRSGSTLAEQILVSTGSVAAAGESQVFPWLLLDLNSRYYGDMGYPKVVARLTVEHMASLQRDYLGTISEVYTQAPVFVDKQFTNYKFVGLLARLFPDARFVHTVRDPLDIILSTYQHVFPNLGFSHDLGHLALAYRHCGAVITHWHEVLPGRIHELVYEDVVTRPETTIRALLEFCGLPWTDRALHFHESRHAVKTASVLQVRQPLYQSSVGRWRPYAALLEPARRVLAGGPQSA